MEGAFALLELLRPWISTGALLGLLTLAYRLHVENRRLRIAENKDDREGYGVLIKALQDDIIAVRAEHRRCEDRLSKIEGELMGFHRQALIQSQQGAAVVPASAIVRDAGERAVEAATRAAERRENRE
jgi:hypothetical protein